MTLRKASTGCSSIQSVAGYDSTRFRFCLLYQEKRDCSRQGGKLKLREKRSSPKDSRKGRGLISSQYIEGAVNKCYSNVIIIFVITRIYDVNNVIGATGTARDVRAYSRNERISLDSALWPGNAATFCDGLLRSSEYVEIDYNSSVNRFRSRTLCQIPGCQGRPKTTARDAVTNDFRRGVCSHRQNEACSTARACI
jgi:hypothetical protein